MKVLMILGMKKQTTTPSGPRRLGDFGRTDLVIAVKNSKDESVKPKPFLKVKIVAGSGQLT